jgi:antitoxin component of MazEF toxin-antitoxin module
MEQIETRAKKWGNSLGIVLPSKVVEKEKIDEETDLVISVRTKKKTTVGELMEFSKKMGIAKKLSNVDTAKALKEIDRAFWPEEE